ncbi:hypothetical protein HOY80DRAFT_775865 [Tuber brumale]|nr:hypothetical protein HOY80DRAFT_775865 [Tuber brumale]
MINIILGDKQALVPSCCGGRLSGWMRVSGGLGGPGYRSLSVYLSVCTKCSSSFGDLEEWAYGGVCGAPGRHGRYQLDWLSIASSKQLPRSPTRLEYHHHHHHHHPSPVQALSQMTNMSPTPSPIKGHKLQWLHLGVGGGVGTDLRVLVRSGVVVVRMVVGAGCQSLPASMPANNDDGAGGGCVRAKRTEHRLGNSHFPLL